MSQSSSIAATHADHERRAAADTTLHGHGLWLARALWAMLAVIVLGLFVAGVPGSVDRALMLQPDTRAGLQELGLPTIFPAIYINALDTIMMAGFAGIGILIAWRRSDDWMALFVSIMLMLTALLYTAPLYETGAPLLVIAILCGLAETMQVTFVFLFPNGRFVPRRIWIVLLPLLIWRPAVWYLAYLPNFYAGARTAETYTFIPQSTLDIGLLLGMFLIGIGAQFYRYRRISTPMQRQQTKWLLLGVVIAILMTGAYVLITINLFTGGSLSDSNLSRMLSSLFGRTARNLALLMVPVTLAYSILRHRLWDIDILLNRALVYGLLTGVLATVYFASVVSLQTLLRPVIGRDSQLAAVGSTLAIAALFQPMRGRIQTAIDRRFYRRKYDAQKTLEAFGARLRNQTDLDAVTRDILAVVQETLQPAHVSLWRRDPVAAPPYEIAPDDPFVTYVQHVGGALDLERLDLRSPATEAMRAAGVQLAVPLVSQGELIGVLNLGPRLSEQQYSADDRALLNSIATQAAPSLRVAQLVREQHAEARERERIAQELRVAGLIQQTLLPREMPALDGWQLERYYQPAREVGGDFYDFIDLPDGRLGLVIGDVTDKGVPAALVMATTRSIMRGAAQSGATPGQVLARVNAALLPDMPRDMFVTCLYAILDPATGHLHYANAGHDVPYLRRRYDVEELLATGVPLGLLADMVYEEGSITLAPGDLLLFYSDGLLEAHNGEREMFSFPRLHDALSQYDPAAKEPLVTYLLDRLEQFTGPDWEQEDDITLVTIQRAG